ncbi:MAG: cupin domain-containing protein [Rhodospirillaceae bacterium]|nr:cupin domain-containing protein [Rhodospirillaceae bacterium]
MNRPILNIDDVEYQTMGHGERFAARRGAVGQKIGAQKLGYNVTVVPPGKRAFPFHSHRVNEEMFFVLEGEGEVRIGKATYPIRRGDFMAHPPGGPETAHQIVNTSATVTLKYLAVSTKLSPEIADYPDSGKFGVLAELVGEDGKPQSFRFLGRAGSSLDYWDGE